MAAAGTLYRRKYLENRDTAGADIGKQKRKEEMWRGKNDKKEIEVNEKEIEK